MYVYVCIRVCVRACVHVHMCVRVHVYVRLLYILHVQWLILIRAPRDQSPGTIGGMHQRTTRRFCWSVDAKETAGMVDVHFWLVTG